MVSRGGSLVAVLALLNAAASLVVDPGVSAHRLQQLWHMGLAALRHVGSPQTRERTGVSCIARRILNHWTTREAPPICIF